MYPGDTGDRDQRRSRQMAHGELTPRERNVLRHVASGATAKEIAIRLDIAPRTVEKHIDHVRLKMRAKNRVHLIAIALQSGLLADSNGENAEAGA
jgi:DNA-binding CsgD family transcriptional regulator